MLTPCMQAADCRQISRQAALLCHCLCILRSAALVPTSGLCPFQVLSGWSSTRTCGFWWRYGRYSAALSSKSASRSLCVYLRDLKCVRAPCTTWFAFQQAAGEQQDLPYCRRYEYNICFFCVKGSQRRDVELVDPPLVNREPLRNPETVSHVYHVAERLEPPKIFRRPGLEARGDVCHIDADSPMVAASHRPRNYGPVLTARASYLSATTTGASTVPTLQCAYLSSCLWAVGSRSGVFADAQANSAALTSSAKGPFLAIAATCSQHSRAARRLAGANGHVTVLFLISNYGTSESLQRYIQIDWSDAVVVGCTLS